MQKNTRFLFLLIGVFVFGSFFSGTNTNPKGVQWVKEGMFTFLLNGDVCKNSIGNTYWYEHTVTTKQRSQEVLGESVFSYSENKIINLVYVAALEQSQNQNFMIYKVQNNHHLNTQNKVGYALATMTSVSEQPFFASEGYLTVVHHSKTAPVGSMSVVFKNASNKSFCMKGFFRAKNNNTNQRLVRS